MSYDYKSEYRKFIRQWNKQKEIMIAAGMDDESIQQLFDFDKDTFNSNRKYGRHLDGFTDLSKTEIQVASNFEKGFSLIEMLGEDASNAFALLSAIEKETVVLRFDYEMTFVEISKQLDASEKTVRQRYDRAMKKLKKYFGMM